MIFALFICLPWQTTDAQENRSRPLPQEITVNKNTVPFDTRKPLDPSGIRLGTPALTTRGFNENDMKVVADLIATTIHNPKKEIVKQEVRKKVRELTAKYPIYENY